MAFYLEDFDIEELQCRMCLKVQIAPLYEPSLAEGREGPVSEVPEANYAAASMIWCQSAQESIFTDSSGYCAAECQEGDIAVEDFSDCPQDLPSSKASCGECTNDAYFWCATDSEAAAGVCVESPQECPSDTLASTIRPLECSMSASAWSSNVDVVDVGYGGGYYSDDGHHHHHHRHHKVLGTIMGLAILGFAIVGMVTTWKFVCRRCCNGHRRGRVDTRAITLPPRSDLEAPATPAALYVAQPAATETRTASSRAAPTIRLQPVVIAQPSVQAAPAPAPVPEPVSGQGCAASIQAAGLGMDSAPAAYQGLYPSIPHTTSRHGYAPLRG